MLREIENKIRVFIKKHRLIIPEDEIVIGVSGGADSMALFHFLYKHKEYYNIDLKVAHVHHGVREQAEEDARYVEKICNLWEVPYFRHDCNIKQISETLGMSEEEAGRKERYHFFISLTNEHGKIATAHNMNDQAETMLMRFLRGTDIKGLSGIMPKRENIIRPILCLNRKEIEHYCEAYQLNYKSDHTNFLPIYTRNKIRLECIPYIENAINPNVVTLLAEHAEIYREEEEFLLHCAKAALEKCVKKETGKIVIESHLLQKEHGYIQKKIILLALSELSGQSKDITLKHVESVKELFDKQSGREVHLPYGMVAFKEYGKIFIKKDKIKSIYTKCMLKLGENKLNELSYCIQLTLCDRKTFEQTQENMYTKYIDYDKIKDNLQLRTRRPQDFIVLNAGTKSLKKFFIDEKVPKQDRDTLPFIADGNEVVWLIGKRLNINYYVKKETVSILEIKIITEQKLQEGLC